MKKAKMIALLLMAILVVSVATAYGYMKITKPDKMSVMSEYLLPDLNKNQLVNHATDIISGEVVSSEVQDDVRGWPMTDYIIKVDKVFKGDPGVEVEVRTHGGENAKMKYIPGEDAIDFKVGERVVLFLSDDKEPDPNADDFGYYVVGVTLGKLKEENGTIKNEKFTFDATTFEQELEQIEKDNKAKGLKQLKAEPGEDGI